ncbi:MULTISPECIES: M81 family metallopeptidase [Paenibacillus]|uniref:M81 family metallopeptidase n=1 Tax=Paenibacillus TaxID=44249 RepID=UPI0021B19182|nr:M81 family metallopeptidase [Paenibacillus sp. IHBB 10380]
MNDSPTAKRMRIAVAGMYHETNTFAPFKTGLGAFRGEWTEGGDEFKDRYKGTRTTMGGVIDAAEQDGIELVPGVYTSATPGGLVTEDAISTLLKAVSYSVSRHADGLILILHGAMVAEGRADPEGELLKLLRVRLGRNFPIAVTFDMHGNISPGMLEAVDIMIGYDTYPHIDMYERAIEAFSLLKQYILGTIRPARACAFTGMLVVPQAMTTDQGPMKDLLDRAHAIEQDSRVLNVSVVGGFPYADTPYTGMCCVVTTDGDVELAKRYAVELGQRAVEWKERFWIKALPPSEAIAEALIQPPGLIVLAEGSDNVGGGAPGDATHLLRCLIELREKGLMVIADKAAVEAAFRSGIGGIFESFVGGRHDRLHGDPVRVTGKVRLLFDGDFQHAGPYMRGHLASMGRTALIQSGSLTLILTEKRIPPWDIGHVRSVGIWPGDYRIIAVKSAVAWEASFGETATSVIHVDSPGCCSVNLKHFDYRHVLRPAYPLDEEIAPVVRCLQYVSEPQSIRAKK